MSQIKNRLKPGRVAVIYGPRRVGKTTLLHNFLEEYDGKYKLYNGEDLETQKIFTVQSAAKYQSLLRGLDLLVIDEAQKIENIGLNLKLIVDTVEGLNIIAADRLHLIWRNMSANRSREENGIIRFFRCRNWN